MSPLASGSETVADSAGGSATSSPPWLHVVVAWTLALVCVVFVGVLALLGDPIPSPLLIIGGVSVGGALGLTNPLTLIQ